MKTNHETYWRIKKIFVLNIHLRIRSIILWKQFSTFLYDLFAALKFKKIFFDTVVKFMTLNVMDNENHVLSNIWHNNRCNRTDLVTCFEKWSSHSSRCKVCEIFANVNNTYLAQKYSASIKQSNSQMNWETDFTASTEHLNMIYYKSSFFIGQFCKNSKIYYSTMKERNGMALFRLGIWKTRGLRKRWKADKSPMQRERW